MGDIFTSSPPGIMPSPGPLMESWGSLERSYASILASIRSPTLNLELRSWVAGEKSRPKTNWAGR